VHHDGYSEDFVKKTSADTTSVATMSPDTQNVLKEMIQLEQDKTPGKSTNKVGLDVEKGKDTVEQEVKTSTGVTNQESSNT
jgi:hypothetical protein